MNDQTITRTENSKKVDLSEGFIEIYNQGGLGSCGVNSFCALFNYHLVKQLGMKQPILSIGLNNCLSTCLLSCFRSPSTNTYDCEVVDNNLANKYKHIKPFRPSRYYLYYYACMLRQGTQDRTDAVDGGGTSILTIMNAIKTNGILKELPDEDNNYWQMEKLNDKPDKDDKIKFFYPDVVLTQDEITEANKWANVVNYSPITKTNSAIKAELDKQNPLLIAMKFNQGKTILNDINKQINIIKPIDIPEDTQTFHMMVIVGYDDSDKAYRVRNSWGAGWGYGGYCKLSYDFFQEDTNNHNPTDEQQKSYSKIREIFSIKLDLEKYAI